MRPLLSVNCLIHFCGLKAEPKTEFFVDFPYTLLQCRARKR